MGGFKMTPLGPAVAALGLAVYANFMGAYLKPHSPEPVLPNDDDGIVYISPDQPSLFTGGCSGRCLYGMWLEKYPSVVLGESYNGDDPLNQALREFDPLFENPQARECLRVPIERREWESRPGHGGYMPGPQPGCRNNGTEIDYSPIWAQPEKHSPGKALGPRDMPRLRSENQNYGAVATSARGFTASGCFCVRRSTWSKQNTKRLQLAHEECAGGAVNQSVFCKVVSEQGRKIFRGGKNREPQIFVWRES
jgi:hypothetical protein